MAVAIRLDLMDTPETFTQMSEPKQYNISSLHPYIIEDKNGFMIYYEDYASLKAEVQTLRHQAVHDVSQLGEQSAEIASIKAENEELHKDYEALADEHTKLIDRNARLKAEVERLEKTEEYLQNTLNQYALDDMRLTAEVERLRKHDDDTCRHFIMRTLLEAQNGFLNARVERLRKAGDEILNGWKSNSGSDVERFTKAYWLWITAKEGKQS